MKVWGIGLSRTGTTSLTRILREAGLNIIHYPTNKQMYDPSVDGATDIPVTINFKHLDAVYPDSKFIYTIRHEDDWVNSIVPYLERKRKWNQSRRQIVSRQILYGSPFPDEDQARRAYRRHDEDVRRISS